MDILTICRRIGHSKASVTLYVYGHLIEGADAEAARALDGVLKWRGGQLVDNSCFVATGAGTNYLICLDGDVAERLKAAVC